MPPTVKSLALDFLTKSDVPRSIDEIVKHVHGSRTCTIKGFLACIQNDGQFVRIKPGYIWLESKKEQIEDWKRKNVTIVGTLADIAESFLIRYNEPRHIGEIAEYVLKHRTCSPTNLMWNCANDKRFLVIEPGYLGLKAKKYELEKWKKENITVFGSIADLAAEFCAKYDVPCHKDEIAKYVLQFRKSTTEAVMDRCSQDQRFFHVNSNYAGLHSKKYDLSEWNKQFAKVPTTVTDFAEEFLKTKDEPCHIDEIVKYVSKYRKTNAHYAMQRLGEDTRFFTIRPGYVGLWGKKYKLEEWKKANISAVGQFGDLIEDFLLKKEVPVHIDDIVKHIKKYRACTASSLIQHCRKDKRLKVIRHKYVILKSKKYDLTRWKKEIIGLPGSVWEMVEDFLDRRDMPSHIDDIAAYIEKYSKYKTSDIMSQLMRDARFKRLVRGHVGLRKKRYDLNKWKKQNATAFGIHYFVEEFLVKKDVPCHASEIAKYVAKYRKCSAENVLRGCKGNPQFIRIEPGYVGLKTKNYNLKEWKRQNITVFGTIADIAVDFVAKKESLCQLKAIAKYVTRFRNTSSDQISRYVREDCRLVLYTKGNVGLWGKEYQEKELEKKKLIKGGTIGDIAAQCIAKRKAPCTVDDITEYASQGRKFDPLWIMGNLKEDKRFRFLKNGEIWLRKQKKLKSKS